MHLEGMSNVDQQERHLQWVCEHQERPAEVIQEQKNYLCGRKDELQAAGLGP